uniref:Uncharacterized protein n=1 Tax=Arundo donax TaxID=35708 RepID=A0A0A8YQY3_ARUDO
MQGYHMSCISLILNQFYMLCAVTLQTF